MNIKTTQIKVITRLSLIGFVAVSLLALTPILGETKNSAPIQPVSTHPSTLPWKLDELSKAPTFEWADGTSGGTNKRPRSLYYTGEIYKGKKTKVFAYYANPGIISGDPSKDKHLPAMVLVHGGGGKADSAWVRLWAMRGYAAIAVDLTGSGPDKKPHADGGPAMSDEVKFGAIDGPITDQWQYHAVADMILAHSLIRSFPEVDPEKTALTGSSWGGYLTCLGAALDPRFKAAVPVFGCGFLDQNSNWMDWFNKMSPQSRAKWVALWDPSSYMSSTKVPMLFVNGGTDFAFPPDSYAKTYDLVKAPKNIHFIPVLKHGALIDKPKAVELFIEHHLRGGVSLPQVANPVVNDKNITALVDTKTKLLKAELHYTLDALPGVPKTRKWITLPATLEQKNIVAELPPKEATIWFLTVTDERDALVSSPLMIPNANSTACSHRTY